MGMLADDTVHDGMLNVIATGTEVKVCSSEPSNYTEADGLYMLAKTTISSGAPGTDWNIADGDTDGRKLTLTAQAAIPITNSGTAQHIAICTATSLLAVAALDTPQALTTGNTVSIPAFTFTNSDPT